ncbi:uncharacterized protein LOC110729273 [Chenopodium quinoa]|uniref:uncharacterized protein LOC110729273 n=1 Tax=Chenopodium quinoa TaxID=63459 RepID=UPI000B793522|nr:uncharacterized protein LOC110729273 [Chenopodium quinoa]
MKSQKKAIELREQNQANAEKKEYVHRMGPKTFAEKRPEWAALGLYPKALLVASKEPSSSTITTLMSRVGDFFCSLHSFDKKTGKWFIKGPEAKKLADKLLEHTQEMVEGKFEPSVENDPFTMALGRSYHPGRVVGSGGSLLGWNKVMGPEYTKSGRSQASVNLPGELDSKVASIKEQVRKELVGELNAWAKLMNLPALPANLVKPQLTDVLLDGDALHIDAFVIVYESKYGTMSRFSPSQTSKNVSKRAKDLFTQAANMMSKFSGTESSSRRTQSNVLELQMYLSYDFMKGMDDEEKFGLDNLAWWNSQSTKHPILAAMARDIAIQVPSGSSERGFSASGWVFKR